MLIFKKSQNSTFADFSAVGIDMHSHLIPGVDDGAKDIEDSLMLINGLIDLGFFHLITTPHTLQDIHPNTKENLQHGYSLIESQIPPSITLTLSSEYYLDDQFHNLLENNYLMPFKGNRLLVEFSQISKPHDLEEVIFDLGVRGYQVVIAHPERYLFFHKQLSYLSRLKEMGAELQLNALSLTGHYGKTIRSVSEKLVDDNLIDFLGTDIHHLRHLDALRTVPALKHFSKLVNGGLLKNRELI